MRILRSSPATLVAPQPSITHPSPLKRLPLLSSSILTDGMSSDHHPLDYVALAPNTPFCPYSARKRRVFCKLDAKERPLFTDNPKEIEPQNTFKFKPPQTPLLTGVNQQCQSSAPLRKHYTVLQGVPSFYHSPALWVDLKAPHDTRSQLQPPCPSKSPEFQRQNDQLNSPARKAQRTKNKTRQSLTQRRHSKPSRRHCQAFALSDPTSPCNCRTDPKRIGPTHFRTSGLAPLRTQTHSSSTCSHARPL